MDLTDPKVNSTMKPAAALRMVQRPVVFGRGLEQQRKKKKEKSNLLLPSLLLLLYHHHHHHHHQDC